MVFQVYEQSLYQGEPVMLVKFLYVGFDGSGFGYTNAEKPITFEGITYKPEPITRGKVHASGSADKKSLEVELPQDTEICKLFRTYPPNTPITCVIYQGHANDTDLDFKPVWSGRVLSARFEGSKGVLTMEPFTVSMRRPGLRLKWQFGCPHQLYGPACKAPQNWEPVTIVEVVDFKMVANGFTNDVLNYTGGMVRWPANHGFNYRTIIRADAPNIFTLGGPPQGIGDTAEIVLGCQHSLDYCVNVFNNAANYGGCPNIPTENTVMRNPYI